SAANQSPQQIREINREFRKIRPSSAIFTSDQRLHSIAYGQVPYATEQGIFRRIFEEQGILIAGPANPAEPQTLGVAASKLVHSYTAYSADRMSAFGGKADKVQAGRFVRIG